MIALADRLRAWLPQKLAYAIVRWKNTLQAIAIFSLSRRRPEMMKSMLRKAAVKQLPEGYAVDTHFAPSYNPWDQRMCLIPDGDLFTRSARPCIGGDRPHRHVHRNRHPAARPAPSWQPTSSSARPG